MKTQLINPWTWNEPMGYSQGVLVSGEHRTLHAAGQCSIDADGNPVGVGDLAAQAAQVLDNVESVLEAVGMTLEDVVRYDVYATDLQRYFESGHEHVVKRFSSVGRTPAGGICAQVVALAVPVLDLEITVTACR